LKSPTDTDELEGLKSEKEMLEGAGVEDKLKLTLLVVEGAGVVGSRLKFISEVEVMLLVSSALGVKGSKVKVSLDEELEASQEIGVKGSKDFDLPLEIDFEITDFLLIAVIIVEVEKLIC
jgi:hypothetical protein